MIFFYLCIYLSIYLYVGLQYGFTVQYQNWYKIINNIKANQTYIVTYQGQPKPNQTDYANYIYINSSNINTIGVTNANDAIPYLEVNINKMMMMIKKVGYLYDLINNYIYAYVYYFDLVTWFR